MPIYEYRCTACGSAKEHLQKMSDDPIAQCPACGSADYHKQLSAAGFQLKGSGWYETDFKNGSGGGHSCGSGSCGGGCA
ncbi:MAG: zinc ribbon domain-containing protein [Aquitalea sp.]|nr:zinc ribbon domain-containing protein [Aquitalea sp.]